MQRILPKLLLIPVVMGLIFPSGVLAQTLDRQEFLKQNAEVIKKINSKLLEILDEIDNVARVVAQLLIQEAQTKVNQGFYRDKGPVYEPDGTRIAQKKIDAAKKVVDRKSGPSPVRGPIPIIGGPIEALGQLAGLSTGVQVTAYGTTGQRPVGISDKTTFNIFNEIGVELGYGITYLDSAMQKELYRPNDFDAAAVEDLQKRIEDASGILDKVGKVSPSTDSFRKPDDPLPTWLDFGDPPLKEEIEKLAGEAKSLIAEKKKMLAEARAAGVLDAKTEEKKTGSISTDKYQHYASIIRDNQNMLQTLARQLGVRIVVKTRGGEVLASFNGGIATQATQPTRSGGVIGNLFARPAPLPTAIPTRTSQPLFGSPQRVQTGAPLPQYLQTQPTTFQQPQLVPVAPSSVQSGR
jgi:hypothetical protein